MAWYSTVSDFASKQISALRAQSSEVPDGQPYEAMDGAAARIPFVMDSHESARPRHGFSSEFFKPSSIGWAPSAADRVYEAFDVSQPVAQPEDLRGREKQLQRLLSGVLHRRNHGVVSGPRGSGKTSLVRVFGQCADREGVVVLYAACDAGTTFGELMRDFLEQLPPSSVEAEHVELLEQRVANFGPDSSPHQATSIFAQVQYSQVVIIVDEFDRVQDPVMQAKIASLLKLVSDARLQVRFVLVGGSSAFSDIFSQHPSLVRHITRLSTDPLSKDAIYDLLRNCGERCDMTFSEAAQSLLEQVACGSPYHARLFGMHAALAALDRKAEQVSEADVLSGLAESYEEWASLNKEDAATFRSIITAADGNSAAYVTVARQLATTDEDRLNGASARKLHLVTGESEDEILSAFGTAVELSEERVAFRDATAPQFFIALQKLSQPMAATQRAKGRVDV